MKKRILSVVSLCFISVFVFTSCNDDDSGVITGNSAITAEDVSSITELDNVSNQVNIILDDYLFSDGLASRSESKSTNSETCWSTTIDLDMKNQVVTLNFGDGCELSTGDVVKGKLILTYVIDIYAQSFEATYTYENFYFNDLKITGENKLTVIRENSNGNHESTLTVNEKITWESGDYAMREGVKVREFSEGFGTKTYEDNVFLVTGNWVDTFNDGTIIKGTVIEDLRREMTCPYFVSGTIKLEKNDRYGVLNFGNGTCDNEAVFVLDDESEIQIKL